MSSIDIINSDTVGAASPARANASGKLDRSTALAIGFGLHIAWTCTVMYSTRNALGTSHEFMGFHGGTFSLLYFVSVIVFGISALFLAAFDQKAARYSRSRRAMAVAAAITCAGTLVGALSPAAPNLAVPLECASGAITAVGSVVLMLYWAAALSREKKTTAAACASIGVALGLSLNTMVLQSIPMPASGLCVAAIPVLEFFILRDITPLPIAQGGSRVPFNPLPSNKARFSLRFVAPMAFIGLALGVLKSVSVQSTLGGSTAESIVMLLMAGGMSILLFVLYCLVPRLQENDLYLRVVVPALACLALVLSLMTEGNSTLNTLFLLVAYIIVESLTWVTLASIAHSTHLSPFFLFGVSRGAITLSMLIGIIIPPLIIPLEAITLALPVLFCIVLIALGYAVMPQSLRILSMVSQCPVVRIVSLELDEGISVLPTLQSTEPDRTNEEDASAGMAAASSDEGEVRAVPAEAQELADSVAASVPAAPKSEARLAMESHPGMNAGTSDGERHVGKFSRKIKLIAQTYLLTERETDILFELAKGNSAASIQEKFFISAGTVKTHIRNIYRKLDVHKRQDLLRLIEEFDAHDK